MAITFETFRLQLSQATLKFGLPEGYEQDQLFHFVTSLQDAKRFVDIGANHGIYSYLANINMRCCPIVMVEAQPNLVDALNADIGAWPSQQGNSLSVIGCAASDTRGVTRFSVGELDTIGTASAMTDRKGNVSYFDVETDTIDNLIDPMPHTVFKVDVEGFEYRVFRGALKNISAPHCVVVAELHSWGDPERGKYPLQVMGMMLANGFAMNRIQMSTSYEFKKGTVVARIRTVVRYSPAFLAKYLVRALGLLPILRYLKLAKPAA